MSGPVDPNKPDYLDKGVDAGLKKYGGAKFQDSEKNRGTIEKITDKARQMFEKFTGLVMHSYLARISEQPRYEA